ncbi:MAG: hypothetical protein JST13_12455, partial [Bacteroidetes bacterium]|nr:hypothetical protein [Bacteroidota bacterium]
VESIPPSSPVYNIKYVYIYDVTPDYIYMGYTPGYLNTFVYGPTVVYGTGFYYDPWYYGYYYPRPWTWGFGMCYNPWAGWCMGFGYSFGWFHLGVNIGHPWGGYWGGGWWGPHVYRPPYIWNSYRSYGYYGNNFYRNRNTYVNNYTTNIYNYRRDVVTIDNRRNNFNRVTSPANNSRYQNSNMRPGFNNRPNGNVQPGFQTRPNPQNNVYSDRNGNVFQRNYQNNQWQQRQQNQQWKPVQRNAPQIQNLNRQQQMRDRGFMRSQNFQQARGSSVAPSRSFSRPSGGNGGGGGGFRRRGR